MPHGTNTRAFGRSLLLEILKWHPETGNGCRRKGRQTTISTTTVNVSRNASVFGEMDAEIQLWMIRCTHPFVCHTAWYFESFISEMTAGTQFHEKSQQTPIWTPIMAFRRAFVQCKTEIPMETIRTFKRRALKTRSIRHRCRTASVRLIQEGPSAPWMLTSSFNLQNMKTI